MAPERLPDAAIALASLPASVRRSLGAALSAAARPRWLFLFLLPKKKKEKKPLPVAEAEPSPWPSAPRDPSPQL
jgi:hypothetical protein